MTWYRVRAGTCTRRQGFQVDRTVVRYGMVCDVVPVAFNGIAWRRIGRRKLFGARAAPPLHVLTRMPGAIDLRAVKDDQQAVADRGLHGPEGVRRLRSPDRAGPEQKAKVAERYSVEHRPPPSAEAVLRAGGSSHYTLFGLAVSGSSQARGMPAPWLPFF